MHENQNHPVTDRLQTTYGIEPTLTTAEAAVVVNRKPQTLRKWACLESGPIRPIRINGRLAWRVSDLQALVN